MEQYKHIKEQPRFSGVLAGLKRKYDYLAASELPEVSDDLFNIFYKTGSRTEYENVYFKRRSVLTVSALLYFIYGDEKYRRKMLEIIEAVCGEKTWALPAHVPEKCDSPQCVIDLFNAETAQTLAELCAVCGKNIPHELHSRIHDEINLRIVLPFEENTQHWEIAHHNWAAVCGGSVAMALLLEFPDVFDRVENRILNTMNSYLDGFGNDGICSEGLGYWKYGFRYFTAFAELYKNMRGIDLFNNNKIKKIAQSQQWLLLDKNTPVSFSDCERRESFDLPIASFYRRIYGNDIFIIDDRISDGMDICGRYLGASRALLWVNDDILNSCKNHHGELYFSDVEWYINRKSLFSFTAKAGHNDESHNHNDVGGFIAACNDRQIIADYGMGEYTRDYFSEKRYDIICNSSLGHSVPVIDGIAQSAGKAFCGNVKKASDDIFCLEFSSSYNHKSLINLTRTFELSDICIKISDFYDFNDNKTHNITERFISVIKPELTEDGVVIDNTVLKSAHTPIIIPCPLKDHSGNDDMIYFIDYTDIKDKFSLCIEFYR